MKTEQAARKAAETTTPTIARPVPRGVNARGIPTWSGIESTTLSPASTECVVRRTTLTAYDTLVHS